MIPDKLHHIADKLRKKISPPIKRFLPPYSRYFKSHSPPNDFGNPEHLFETHTFSLPVFSKYRYALKPGWAFFKPLMFLQTLKKQGLASEADILFLESCVGTRTVQKPLNEINQYVQTRLPHFQSYLVPDHKATQTPLICPTETQIQQRIQNSLESHHRLLRELANQSIYTHQKGNQVLEIGFESGGYSLYAFEKLGFSVTGIDNGYGGITNAMSLPDFVKNQVKSNAQLSSGDITRTTDLPENSFDIIYSASVLEHIQDIPAAFSEMFRLLKPKGLLIHKYHPYFCPTGGHALGILDAPWGHCRLTESEYQRYIQEMRPQEAETAIEWTNTALTRDYPIAKMQQTLINAHFEILLWRETDIPPSQHQDLTPQILRECFQTNPHIGLSDLITESILFVAQKCET